MNQFLPVMAALGMTVFNLTCTGVEESESGASESKVTPFTTVFRVDLNRKKWCEGDCKVVFPVQGFDEETVDLKREKTGDVNTPGSSYDRLSFTRGGEMLSEFRWSRPDLIHINFYRRAAQCTEVPFMVGPGIENPF